MFFHISIIFFEFGICTNMLIKSAGILDFFWKKKQVKIYLHSQIYFFLMFFKFTFFCWFVKFVILIYQFVHNQEFPADLISNKSKFINSNLRIPISTNNLIVIDGKIKRNYNDLLKLMILVRHLYYSKFPPKSQFCANYLYLIHFSEPVLSKKG